MVILKGSVQMALAVILPSLRVMFFHKQRGTRSCVGNILFFFSLLYREIEKKDKNLLDDKERGAEEAES